MHHRHSLAALLFTAAVATAANAEFIAGNEIYLDGFSLAGLEKTTWQGFHNLGSTGQQFQNNTFPTQIVTVSSIVNSATSVSISIDFSQYDPAFYSLFSVGFSGLKDDGTLASVIPSQGFAYVQGGVWVHWYGNGSELALEPKVVFTIEQIPAPGALALLGVSGLIGSRRRRG